MSVSARSFSRRPVASASRVRRGAFTLIELLAVIGILGMLMAIFLPTIARVRTAARSAASSSNLRQLATATLTYIGDHRGAFPPAMSLDNLTRWHGARPSIGAPFDLRLGWLGPYLGRSGGVKICPEFALMDATPESFELSAGGYGYNATYLGGPAARGTAQDPFRPARLENMPQPAHTVMFTTTAFARKGGLQEYPFSEPPRWLAPSGRPAGASQPSMHFRFGGRGLVAWCDGRVTSEAPNADAWPGPNYYGGDNVAARIGWFGPTEANGHWNPW